MSSGDQKFKLLKREKDPSFSIDSLERYDLLLLLGLNDLQVAVFDTEEKKILLLEDYILPGITDIHDRLERYRLIFHDHHLLLANFWNEVKVAFKNKKFSLVPHNLVDTANTSVYLDINTPSLREVDTQTYALDDLDITIVYGIEKDILELIRTTYPKAEYRILPHCASFIKGFDALLKNAGGNYNCIYVDRFGFHQTIFKENDLRFYNLFPVSKFEDYQKYIDLVNGNQNLDSENDHMMLWGYIGAQSHYYTELKNRYPTLQLGHRPGHFKMGYVFDQIPEHQYFDLLSLSLID